MRLPELSLQAYGGIKQVLYGTAVTDTEPAWERWQEQGSEALPTLICNLAAGLCTLNS